MIDDGLADTQTETCSLYEVVKFDESLKDTGLLLFGNTGTCVLTIEVETIGFVSAAFGNAGFFAIAHLDVTLVGVLHGIGHEVSQQLLDTALVKVGDIRFVWIVLDEGDARLLHALLQGLTHIIEGLGNVDLLWKDGEGLTHV